jgi:hypothetical protein
MRHFAMVKRRRREGMRDAKKRMLGLRQRKGDELVERMEDLILSSSSQQGSSKDADLDGDRTTPTSRSDNKFACLDEEVNTDVSCRNSKKLKGKVFALLRLLSADTGFPSQPSKIPSVIQCGQLRAAVRGCFDDELPMWMELSIKSTQKAEKSYCKGCSPSLLEGKVGEWKEALRETVEVDKDHLRRFRFSLKENIPMGWNKTPGPYIPNGSATLFHGVSEGGNWHEEPFSTACRATAVLSSGKPRIVTCYSSFNTRVLTPLHHSLYVQLRRKGWLLTGDPTVDHVTSLNGTGPYLSFDYKGATDNIKKAYVEATVEELVERAEGLSYDEIRCLRVLADLRVSQVDTRPCNPLEQRIKESEEWESGFSRGQPMGSAMSFPMLCLINKTVVDLSLTDLLEAKKISFKEWTAHKCLINGDDLLLREPSKKTHLKDAVVINGGEVGLIVNEEKSGVSDDLAEINSTPFVDGGRRREKKTNANSLYMKPDVEDVLGFALDATRTVEGFLRVVKANVGLLACQYDKKLWSLPYPYQAAVRKNKKIMKAIKVGPSFSKDDLPNLFPVVEKPDGYFLDRSDEIRLMEKRVSEVREAAVFLQGAKAMKKACQKYKKESNFGPYSFGPRRKPLLAAHGQSWRSLLKRKKNTKEMILECLAEGFWSKKKDGMKEEGLTPSAVGLEEFHDESIYPDKVSYLVDVIRDFTYTPRQVRTTPSVEEVNAFDLALHKETNVFAGRAVCEFLMRFDKA